jgi:hypothetical protein
MKQYTEQETKYAMKIANLLGYKAKAYPEITDPTLDWVFMDLVKDYEGMSELLINEWKQGYTSEMRIYES